MKYPAEQDVPLHFDDSLPLESTPVRIRNALLIDGHVCDDIDPVTAYSHSIRIGKQTLGPEFGSGGGSRAKKYSRSVSASMHHEAEYCPCKRLTHEELERLGYEECECES